VVAEPAHATFSVENRPGVQTWWLGFAPVNAIGPEFLSACESALAAAEADPDIAVVVVASTLRVFSAGADAKWMKHIVETEGSGQLLDRFKASMDRFRELCFRMRRSELLFVAALGGHTLAGGLELAAACDLRFAADDDRIQIGATEMKLFGVMPSGGGGTQYLSRLMGPSRCLQFLLEAEPVSPRQATTLGLIDRLLAPERVLEDTHSFATRIAERGGRVGVAAAKRLVLDGAELPLRDAIDFDRAVHWDGMRRGGFLRGVDAFMKRFG
jgi:enoyl-CoA hydratase/carnithine racemase